MNMTREIKFRAWDKQVNKMFEVLAIGKCRYWDFPEGGFYSDESGVLVIGFDGPMFLEINEVVVMQYTGLKDKNGVEIYEGDWIDGYGQVTFNHGSFWISSSKGDWGWFFGTLSEEVSIKIIGNIYSNPELLKQTNHE